MNDGKVIKYQLLVALISSVGLVASFPYGAMEVVCFFFMGMSLVLCLLFISFCIRQKKYASAFWLFALNALFVSSSVALWTKYDYVVNTKTRSHVTNKQDAKEFDIMVAEFKQIRFPIIEKRTIKADAFAIYDSWYDNLKDKSRVTVEPSSISYIITIPGNEVSQMFYQKNKKYVICEGTPDLSSLNKNAEGNVIYTTGYVQIETSLKEIPDTIVYHICKYDSHEIIDSLVFKCESNNFHNLSNNSQFTKTRRRSFLHKLKDFFFVEELNSVSKEI